MRKEEVSDILLHLWAHVDQADYDRDITKAFQLCPVSFQKQLIESFLVNGFDIQPDPDMIQKANRLLRR
ncbi:hypothetical protein BCE02nite_46700 [Brevibacillus centrosporus]|nr:hypothetical protein BCE02nite_46700 [Brevibacillus centrosporus]